MFWIKNLIPRLAFKVFPQVYGMFQTRGRKDMILTRAFYVSAFLCCREWTKHSFCIHNTAVKSMGNTVIAYRSTCLKTDL